jgi:hypothetical protein
MCTCGYMVECSVEPLREIWSVRLQGSTSLLHFANTQLLVNAREDCDVSAHRKRKSVCVGTANSKSICENTNCLFCNWQTSPSFTNGHISRSLVKINRRFEETRCLRFLKSEGNRFFQNVTNFLPGWLHHVPEDSVLSQSRPWKPQILL